MSGCPAHNLANHSVILAVTPRVSLAVTFPDISNVVFLNVIFHRITLLCRRIFIDIYCYIVIVNHSSIYCAIYSYLRLSSLLFTVFLRLFSLLFTFIFAVIYVYFRCKLQLFSLLITVMFAVIFNYFRCYLQLFTVIYSYLQLFTVIYFLFTPRSTLCVRW